MSPNSGGIAPLRRFLERIRNLSFHGTPKLGRDGACQTVTAQIQIKQLGKIAEFRRYRAPKPVTTEEKALELRDAPKFRGILPHSRLRDKSNTFKLGR